MGDLRFTFLSEPDAKRLYEQHPELKSDPDKYCPTCSKEGSYSWRGESYTCDCQHQLQLNKHYLNAGIGMLYQRLGWEDYEGDEIAKGLCDKYYSARSSLVSRGTGLMFLGNFGTGKTMSLTLLLKDLLKDGYSVYATTFTSMIEMFTAGWKSADEQAFFQKRVKHSQILLLDDVGKEMRTKTNLAESTFDDVLRSRVQEGRPTFITSNMTVDELGTGYGAAIFSLLKETSILHEFDGEDYREKANRRLLQEALSSERRPIQ